jgi:phage terminase small subunit
VLSHPSVPALSPVPVEAFDAPADLTPEELAVWQRQAPFAFTHGTLSKATALSFERYCKVVVMERQESMSSARGGSNHRGMLKLIDDYEQHFLLTASGKAVPVLEKPDEAQSKLSRFRKATPA